MAQATCEHKYICADIRFNRLQDVEGGPIVRWTVDILIACADCEIPFKFIGLPMGIRLDCPTTDVMCVELRAPIEPHSIIKTMKEWKEAGNVD